MPKTPAAQQVRDQANAIAQQAEHVAHPLSYATMNAEEMHAKALLIYRNAETLVAWTAMQVDDDPRREG